LQRISRPKGFTLRSATKSWHLLPHERSAVELLAREAAVPPVVAQLLLNRRIQTADDARQFLAAPYRGLRDPEQLPGLTQAAERIHAAIRDNRRICVYGDYDVDGLTGTSILWEGLRQLGANPDYYVPHRIDEGYGLNGEALRKIAESGASLVVTVDCGIASVAEAETARELGLELIVTDHHEPKDQLPAAAVLVHPRLPGTSYPFGDLSGAGVAFKLTWGLCKLASGATKVTQRFRDFLIESVGLAALGTIADVVPLRDENRIFVRHGLAQLRNTTSVGIKALREAAGMADKPDVAAADVGYSLAPRLNAAGRLGCARLVVELLTTTSPVRATEIARYLDQQNQARQTIERRILSEAKERLDALDLDATPAIVLADAEWHAGVIGIVAGRLAELYARPTLLVSLCKETSIGQGSGRSVPGFALHEALKACGDGLIGHGGHAAAAGFKVHADGLDAFRERFCAFAAEHFKASPPTPRLVLDAEIPLAAVTPGLVDLIARLEPYGAGNPRPLLLAGPVQIAGEPRRVGGGDRHLRFRVRQENTSLPAIGFSLGDRLEELMSADGWCSLAFTPSINEWQGMRTVQLEVRDFQPGKEARLG
jgi:single-stranded-DNA-specific exonuclease